MLIDDDATQIFVEESEEHLADIESDLLAIEKGGGEIDDDLVNKVFRAVHTVKGGAGFLGYETIKTLAHKMENIMGMIREHKLEPTPDICSVLLAAADSLRNMIQNLESSNDVDVSHHIQDLTAIVEGGAAPQDQPVQQAQQKVVVPKDTALSPERKIHEDVEVAVPPTYPKAPDTPALPKKIPTKKAASRQETTGSEGSLRVNVRLLDQLMTLAGELVLSRNQLVQAVYSKNMTSIEVVKQRIDLITLELQEAVMFTRMQPIGKVFNLFPRLTRELSLELGKEVELVVEGEDVELDKTIIESINAPLTHLIRNSIDHGIEMSAERELAHKDKVGRIVLRASHKAGLVILDVIDDGRGMSPEKIASAVLKRGILDEDQIQLLSDKEKLNLIFLPGFSTTESVSEISGRGVGMDVVKTNLDKLGGQVEISSIPGKGTAIQIKLPLTLAIISAQIIICRNERYSIPQVNLEELIRVAAHEVKDKIEVIGKSPVLKLRGDLLPLVKLMDVLGGSPEYIECSTGEVKKERRRNIADRRSFKTKFVKEQREDREEGQAAKDYVREEGERRGKSGMLYIAIVNAGNLKYGLVVDALLDAEEVVVKPLGHHLQGIKKYSGATIMGDGRVSLILDVGNIAREVGLVSFENSERARQLSLEMQESARKLRDVQSFLLFRNEGTEQFCVPLHLVLRVIKVKSSEIEYAGGKRVLQYCGDSLPLFSIDEVADITPLKDHDDLLVIIFHVTGRQVGLLASKPVNAIEMFLSVDDETYHQPGIMGSVIIEKRITLLVNIYEVVKILNPHWFASQNDLVPMIDKHTILVADDSAFFQSLMAKILREEGFHVIVAEDGQDALEKLRENAKKVSMLVTDIEMPRMNGFELTTKIRDDPAFVNLPIIAITTLAGEADRQRGKRAGVNEYLVKFDRDLLVKNVLKLLSIK